MELTYKELETTLAAHLRIKPDRVGTLRSRIKQLQRLEFPGGVNIGRGSKMAYTSEHLLKLALAFELIGLGQPALTATMLVEKHWAEIAGAFALCWIVDNNVTFHASKKRTILLEIKIESMFELQFARFDGPDYSSVSVYDIEWMCQTLDSGREEGPYASIIVNLVELYVRVTSKAQDPAGVSGAKLNREAKSWLIKDDRAPYYFAGIFPDRSNLKMRKRLNTFCSNDPEAVTDVGKREAQDFERLMEEDFLPF